MFKLLFASPKEYPELSKDVRAELTAPLRNKIHNIKTGLSKNHYGLEGHIGVRVRRAKRNSHGDPVDKNGNAILNVFATEEEYIRELQNRCVYGYGWIEVEKHKHNIITTNGRDWVHEQIWTNAAAGSAEQAAHEIALTVDATGTDVADDALPGEITTGGLGKKNADTVTHTDNTNTTTLVTTWTASGSHTAVQMAGSFYNPTASTGQLILENTFTSTNLISGDSIELTWTITTG